MSIHGGWVGAARDTGFLVPADLAAFEDLAADMSAYMLKVF